MKKERIVYLDHIKILLTILVIGHHTAQAFTEGEHYIVKSLITTQWLRCFLTVNMTFFMGAFFFISGYFVPKSRENKSIGKYIKSKASRLLIPVLALIVIIVPLFYYIAFKYNNGGSMGLFKYYIDIYWGTGIESYEHGWFILSLFLYSMLYLPFDRLLDHISARLTLTKIVVFVAVMALLTHCIRLVFPINQWASILWVIGIEPAHLPQYLMMFFAGALCYKKKWLDQLSERMGKVSAVIGLLLIVIIYAQFKLPDSIINIVWKYFATYESVMAVTIMIGLLYLFRRFCHGSKFTELLAQNAFGAYIVHILFVLCAQILAFHIKTNATVKYLIAYSLAVICSFTAAFLLRKIPWVRKIV